MITDPRSQSEKAAEQRLRNQRTEEYNRKMGLVTLPLSAVTLPKDASYVTDGKQVTLQEKHVISGKSVLRNKPKSRATYMREYRQRLKLCPHCGKEL